METKVLSIPASGTHHLIKKYRIHAFPYPRTYDYSNLVTFRKKGGVMETLYKVEETCKLNMDEKNLYDSLERFNITHQDRIIGYIEERKRDFSFEKPEFMFWILKKEKEMLHKPVTNQSYNSHVYYTYDELSSGKKKVTIASRQSTNQKADLESKFKSEFKQIEENSVSDTEREQIIKARIGQSKFKQGLLKSKTECNLCSVIDERLLIASHIKPWKKCDNSERLDLDNGLLLCPNHDWLFDKGYISFTNKGEILITETLDELTKTFMNVNQKMYVTLNKNQITYIEWHRNNEFIK